MKVNEEIERRVPVVDATGAIPKPTQAPRPVQEHARHASRDGRDKAATLGCVGLAFIALTALAFIAAILFRAWVDRVEEEALAKSMDGSTAGANAVTVEELKASIAHSKWESGAWSVTEEDLEREYELGNAYPANGRDAFLTANTTYGRGAGMVDLVTYDTDTNVMIRHYGQLDQYGHVRWYAAETMLDEDGKPRVMPRD